MSPDGRWLALVTSAAGPGTGTQEVVVTDYPPGARRIVISRGGGVAPLWRADGRELFYRTYDGGVMSVS